MSSNSLAGILTHNQIVEWPSTGLRSQNLTTVYSVLLRLATTNWLPSVNANIVYEVENCKQTRLWSGHNLLLTSHS